MEELLSKLKKKDFYKLKFIQRNSISIGGKVLIPEKILGEGKVGKVGRVDKIL